MEIPHFNAKVTGLIFIGLIPPIAIGVIWLIMSTTDTSPEVQLAAVALLGVGLVAYLLYLFAVGYRLLGLADGAQALALPRGSVRALIALFLLFAFIIVSIYAHRQIQNRQMVMKGLTQAEINRIDGVVVEKTLSPDQVSTNTPSFDLVVSQEPNDASVRVAQQLVTILGTLVSAIAAFYFGTRTVSNDPQPDQPGKSTDGDTPKRREEEKDSGKPDPEESKPETEDKENE